MLYRSVFLALLLTSSICTQAMTNDYIEGGAASGGAAAGAGLDEETQNGDPIEEGLPDEERSSVADDMQASAANGRRDAPNWTVAFDPIVLTLENVSVDALGLGNNTIALTAAGVEILLQKLHRTTDDTINSLVPVWPISNAVYVLRALLAQQSALDAETVRSIQLYLATLLYREDARDARNFDEAEAMFNTFVSENYPALSIDNRQNLIDLGDRYLHSNPVFASYLYTRAIDMQGANDGRLIATVRMIDILIHGAPGVPVNHERAGELHTLHIVEQGLVPATLQELAEILVRFTSWVSLYVDNSDRIMRPAGLASVVDNFTNWLIGKVNNSALHQLFLDEGANDQQAKQWIGNISEHVGKNWTSKDDGSVKQWTDTMPLLELSQSLATQLRVEVVSLSPSLQKPQETKK